MKFLKLELNDFELYNVDENPELFDYLESNIHGFKRMYEDQGDDFWLRHLFTLREYFYILIQARFQHEDGQCLHWLIVPVEKMFMQIHKLVLVKGFDAIKKSFKNLKKNIKKSNSEAISYLTNKEKWQLITSCSIRMAYRSLFGSNLGHSKADAIKTSIAIDLYKHVCKSFAVLLKRYENAVDIPKSSDTQYWKPFPHWTKKDYHPELFEVYIARYYKERLPEILLLPDVRKIFCDKDIHNCCNKFIKDYSYRMLEGERGDFFKKRMYQPCNKHDSCFIRRVHGDNCQNPVFCSLNKSSCSFICDTEIHEMNALKENKQPYWKHHVISIHTSSKKKYRDVGTLTKTNDSGNIVEEYHTHTIDYGCDWDEENESPFWTDLPPDFANFARQLEKKEKTKSRLRNKLSKRIKEVNREENSQMTPAIEVSQFLDFTRRSTLFYCAKIRFRNELGDELLCKLFKEKMEKSSSPLVDIFEGKYELHDLCSKQISSRKRSVAVGCNAPLNWKFLTNLKKMHIRKRLSLAEKEPFILEESAEILDETDNAKALDNNNGTITNSVLNKQSTKSISTKKKDNKKTKKKNSKACQGDLKPQTTELSDNLSEDKSKHTSCKVKQSANNHVGQTGEQFTTLTADQQKACKTKPNIKITNTQQLNSKLNTPSPKERVKIKEIVTIMESSSPPETIIQMRRKALKNITTIPKSIENGENSVAITYSIPKLKEIVQEQFTTEKVVKQLECFENVSEKDMSATNNFQEKPTTKLRICALCEIQELTRHSFKKCKLCKTENVKEPRYYCSRDCQMKDWKLKHQNDHKNNSMIN